MPADSTYSLAELSRLTTVTARTIRYYVGQGLLPSPGAGPSARYGETHLARLRLIRRLQREHLPLAEIRRRLEDMPDDEVIALSDASPPATADSAVDYIRRLTSPPPAAHSLAEAPASSALPAPVPGAPEPDRSTWERHTVAPDVEIHIRRPLDRHTAKRVDRLIRIARDLLADES